MEQEADYMALTWRAKTIGPSLPSFYLDDDRLPFNKTYGFNLFSSNVSCLAWLDKQLPCSVVLVSYGTVSDYDEAQLEELGNGLCNSGKPFLWVVRANEEHKLSDELRNKCEQHGLIVSWCNQLDVLAHKATGTENDYSHIYKGKDKLISNLKNGLLEVSSRRNSCCLCTGLKTNIKFY